MTYSISVIVPFFNEEKYIEKSVKRLIETKLFNQVILVNDGSTDKSPKIAIQLSENYENVQLISLKAKQGKGNAIKVGLKKIKTSHVIIHDADLEYFPSDISEMFDIAKINQKSLILGSRTIGSKKRINQYKITYLANKYYSIFFSIINFYKVSDIASCYWLLETELLKQLNIKEKGFAIEVEVLSKYLKLYSNIIEVPISYEGRQYSEGKKIKIYDGLNILYKIIIYSKLNPFFNFRKLKGD